MDDRSRPVSVCNIPHLPVDLTPAGIDNPPRFVYVIRRILKGVAMTPEETSQTSPRQPKGFVQQLLTAKAYFVFLHIVVAVLLVQVYLLTEKVSQLRNPQRITPLQVGDTFLLDGLSPLDSKTSLVQNTETLVFEDTCWVYSCRNRSGDCDNGFFSNRKGGRQRMQLGQLLCCKPMSGNGAMHVRVSM